MERVKRTNIIIVHPNQQAVFMLCNIYTMDIDRRNMNCYNYGRFGHLARNCKNRRIGGRIGKDRRLEYKRNK